MVRESMDFDVVIVGGGPAGLSTSIKLMQISEEKNLDLNICLLEKGSEIGAHILSGAVIDTRALDTLLPDWESENGFIQTPVKKDEMLFLHGEHSAINVPNFSFRLVRTNGLVNGQVYLLVILDVPDLERAQYSIDLLHTVQC